MKSNFKKLLTIVVAAYAASASVQAKTLEKGRDYALSSVKIPDFYNDAYLVMHGTSLLARESNTREDQFGGMLSVVAGLENVISGSRGSLMLGKAFSPNGNAETASVGVYAEGAAPATFLDARDFVHMYFPAPAAGDYNPFVGLPAASIKGNQPDVEMSGFEAKHRRVFADLSYVQDLGNFYEGLKISVSTTLMHVRNNLAVTFKGIDPKPVAPGTTQSGTGITGAADGTQYWNAVTISEFFKGSKGAPADSWNQQAALAHGKFVAGDQSEVGMTDIRASLSLNVLDNDSAKVDIALDGVVPVPGGEIKGENLFEPVVATRHFKIGAKLNADASLVDGSDYSANLNVQALWHYSFPRKSNRLPWDKATPFGHYALGYKAEANKTMTLRPLIDIVFEDQPKVNVKPGQRVSLMADASFEKGSLVIDALYKFGWEGAENNDAYTDITGLCKAYSNNDPGIAERAKSTGDATWGPNGGAGVSYAISSLLTTRHDSQFTHEFAVGAAFMFKEWQYPAGIGLRAGYTIAQDRTRNPEKWSLAIKGSLCF